MSEIAVETVRFHSDGARLTGRVRKPSRAREPLPAVVYTPGWLALAESESNLPWFEGFAGAGRLVLSFDHRGFGESEGERGWVRPDWQLEDILSAVTYLTTRPDVRPDAIGLYGRGGTGGGNAVLAGALDERVRCVIAQTPVSDGRTWLRGMRREYEWIEFLRRLEEDRVRRVLSGEGELVDPRAEIMIAAPERGRVAHKKEVDERIGDHFYLATADHVLRYRPVEMAHRLAGRGVLIVCVEDDAVTPPEHGWALYRACSAPRRLIVQTRISHYQSYVRDFDVLMGHMNDWLSRFLVQRRALRAIDLDLDDVIFL